MTAENLLLIVGIACIIAATVGGGVKAGGVLEIPSLQSVRRQFLLGIVGVLFIVLSQGDKVAGYLSKRSSEPVARTTPTEPVPSVSEPVKPSAPTPSAPTPSTAAPSAPTPSTAAPSSTPSQKPSLSIPKDATPPINESVVFAIQSRRRRCPEGTYNVYVASGFGTEDAADQRTESFQKRFPKIKFFTGFTIANDGSGRNQQFAVVVGQGLNESEARILKDAMRRWGVAADAYYTYQTRDGDCPLQP